MSRDLIIHNRIARLAADLTPAAFACLVTFDSESDSITVVSVSGISTPLFSQVNNSARRSHGGWVPSITVGAAANIALETIFRNKKSVSATVGEFIDRVLPDSLINSTFDQFTEQYCTGIPIIIDDEVCAAILYASSVKFTKPQVSSCQAFADKVTDSLSRLFAERKLTEQIEELIEQRRQIQTADPIGLTQRNHTKPLSPRTFADIHLSLETQTAIRGERELNLTRREFDLLDTFLQSAGTALSRVQIISRVWAERNGVSSNVLNVTVKNLRDKLEAAGESRVIHSVRAYGYILKN
ncbi:MAG: winged helix-turn-helix transcriptional regulator [Chloroflexi bacterium]|nr:winged helix-turn-helix transcriptional regulator [Chloroflexota bacterium]